MQWIGLTGGIATGKSTVANLFRDRGYTVLDADEEARLAVRPGSPALVELVQVLGQKILNHDQSLNRSALANLIFGDRQILNRVESIIHPRVQASVQAQREELAKQGVAIAFYDVPLLFEKNLESQFDSVVLVYCPRVKQIERIKKRNLWTDSEIALRLSSQIDIEEKKKRSSWIISNEASFADLESSVEDFLRKISAPRPK